MAVAEDLVVQVVSVAPCGVGSGVEFVVGAEAQLQVQVSAAELAPAGRTAVVCSTVVGLDRELGEMVERAATVVEKLVLPEVAG